MYKWSTIIKALYDSVRKVIVQNNTKNINIIMEFSNNTE